MDGMGTFPMDFINDLLDRLPVSRGFLIVLIIISLFVWKMNKPFVDAERSVVNFQSEIDQRKKRVSDSVANLVVSDPGLLNCIRESARDRVGIHPANTGGIDDVSELEMLYCRGGQVSSIAGIGQLPNLKYLDLSSNGIHSLSPLRNHPNLKSLNVTENPLQDIAVISSLASLKELYLPNMPELPCSDLEGLPRGIKGNSRSIRCAGAREGKKAQLATQRDFAAPRSEGGSSTDRLTAAQQQELLEYEREMRQTQ